MRFCYLYSLFNCLLINIQKSVYKYTKGVMHVYINKYQCNNIYNLSKITACFNYWVCCIISVFNYYQQPYTILLDFHAILILKDFLFVVEKSTQWRKMNICKTRLLGNNIALHNLQQ